ncbi:hypothetical protein BON22_3745 [Cyberlindnera fabianii]|uniref:Uncharacterized protein n=1 Tax=Cyberlindnera fabianii TaxID=36022 RepID=A0A1V2L3E9_CYBFA|nr:hypothetical protein BON22_3745 [Cyberlindnera fabianii]
MKFSTALISTAIASFAVAAPSAESLPWARANPQAMAAAEAYAAAYAEAEAIGHADPEAYALAASADDCASVTCHMACGLMIIAGQSCSENTENNYNGPYEDGCLCGNTITSFKTWYNSCMDCGWTLWKYYSGYLENALIQCAAENPDYPATEPTGTSRCSTTLTDSYTVDTNINYSTYI